MKDLFLKSGQSPKSLDSMEVLAKTRHEVLRLEEMLLEGLIPCFCAPVAQDTVRDLCRIADVVPARMLVTEEHGVLLCYRDTPKALSVTVEIDSDGDIGVIYQLLTGEFGSCDWKL